MQRPRSNLELQLYPGDEHVGSRDPECLQVLTYAKLSNASVCTQTSCNPWASPSGDYPVLQCGPKTVVSKPENIITYIKEQGFNIDDHLHDYQSAETTAYAALLRDKLLPAILHTRWLDGQNYTDVTRRWYGQFLYFPLSIIIPSWRHRCVHHLIMREAGPDCTLEQRGMELLTKAEECVNLLSARLGDEDYFFGSRPSSLDALVFGYLEVILECPLPSNNSLHSQLHSCVNLVRFCERLRQRCFPGLKQRSLTSTPSLPTVPTSDQLWRDPTVWASMGVALALLGIQGMRVGLFRRLTHWLPSRRAEEVDHDSSL